MPTSTTGAKYPGADNGGWIEDSGNISADDNACYATNDGNPTITTTNYGFTFTGTVDSIDGIEVIVQGGSATKRLDIDLSYDAGTNYTAEIQATIGTSSGSGGAMVNVTFGGSANTWGRTWTSTELNNANFILRAAKGVVDGGVIDVDYITVNVYYTYTAASTGGTLTTRSKFW